MFYDDWEKDFNKEVRRFCLWETVWTAVYWILWISLLTMVGLAIYQNNFS